MDKGGGSQMQYISEDKIHLLFISSLWELNSFYFFPPILWAASSSWYFHGRFIKSALFMLTTNTWSVI